MKRAAAIFPERKWDEIKLRRCAAHGKHINFHTDFALETMQVPLVGDDSYRGGRLVFLNESGVRTPKRPAGSATVHNNRILHGVSELVSGVRYSLFFLRKR